MVTNMMRLLLVGACLLWSAGVYAQELKIGVLSVQRAVAESSEAQAALREIQQDLGERQAEIQQLNSEMEELRERLARDGDVMSQADVRRLQRELEDQEMEYEYKVTRFQKDVNDRQEEVMNMMMPRINAVLADLVEQEGYDVILHRQNILYAADSHDITSDVTERLNAAAE